MQQGRDLFLLSTEAGQRRQQAPAVRRTTPIPRNNVWQYMTIKLLFRRAVFTIESLCYGQMNARVFLCREAGQKTLLSFSWSARKERIPHTQFIRGYAARFLYDGCSVCGARKEVFIALRRRT
jgi:hypothetical protein